MRTHATPSERPHDRWQLWWAPLASSPRRSRRRTHLTHAHVSAIGVKAAIRIVGVPLIAALALVLVAALSLLFATAPGSS